MKRFLAATFGTALLAGSLVTALPAHAQLDTGGIPLPDSTIQARDVAPVTGTDLIVTQPTLNNDGTVSTQTTNVPFTPSSASASGDNSAARGTPSSLQDTNTNDSGYDSIMTWIMRLFAWLVGVAAITLDNAVYYTVIHMGTILNSSQGGLSAIGVAWRILRDIGNIILLFGFVAIGIATILNVQTYGARRMLPMLLISAVMLNFSLFIAEAVIDVGNLFGTEFFVQINNGQMPSGPVNYSQANVHNEGISNKIMAQVGLQTLYNANLPQNQDLLKSGNLWIVGFMAIILFLIASFVMFSLAFVLIARFVFLIFLIIVAPVGIAGLAIPKLDKYASMWWSKLFEQTITAPVLLLMLYVALAVITDANFLTGFGITNSSQQNAWVAFLNNGNGDVSSLAGMMLAFLVAMGLLLAVTMLSKSMSAFGASAATKWGGRLSFGAASVAAGLGVGGAARSLRFGLQRSPIKHTQFAKTVSGMTRPLETANLDFRKIGVVSAGLSAAGAGEAAKPTTAASYRQVTAAANVRKQLREVREASNREYDKEMKTITSAQAKQSLESEVAAGSLSPASQQKLAKMSVKELEELKGIKDGVGALVENLSPQQFEGLMKSEKLADSEKGKIKTARYSSLAKALEAGNEPAVKKELDRFSKGELESMPPELLLHANPGLGGRKLVLEKLSDKQRETITDSKERTATEKQEVRESSASGRVEALFEAATSKAAGAAAVTAINPATGKSALDELTTPQIVKLKKDILKEPAVAAKLTTNTLMKLAEENKFTPAEMSAIGVIIRTSPSADKKTQDYITTGPGAAIW